MKFLGLRKIGWATVCAFALCACETPQNGDVAAPTSSPPTAALPSEPEGGELPAPAELSEATELSGASEQAAESARREVAILAGGCFWGMEDILRDIPGVLETEVGYSGGKTSHPTYADVKEGKSGHAESVRIVFDPSRLSFSALLQDWFFRMHDPTTKNRQGNDIGSQYRSAIFYSDETQRATALTVIKRVNDSEQWDDPIVTEVAPAGEFTSAESYHQDYLEKNPGGYTCHYMRDPAL